MVGAALLAGGWLMILFVNRWVIAAPVVFLCLGWLALLAGGRFLWVAALAAGGEGLGPDGEGGGFELGATRLVELQREKKSLLKAIKDVEFDREMGKMSDRDASEIVEVYRARAIEVLKELDLGSRGAAAGQGVGPGRESVDDIIERELRARLALAGVQAKAVEKAARKKKAAEAEPDKAEPDKVEPDKVEPDEAEPDKVESDEAEPDRAELAKVEPDKAEPAAAEQPAAAETTSDEGAGEDDESRREASE